MAEETLQPQLGERIARRRGELGLTQKELAERVGVQRLAIINIESGKAEPGFLRIRSLAEALGVTVDELTAPSKEDGDAA